MSGIWGRGRQQSQGMSKSPRSFPAIFVEEEQENCQNQATQPHLQNAHACAHTQAAKQQPQGRTRVPTRCLLASCGSGLQGTLCHPSTSGTGFAGDLTARTKQQWPVQKWPKRGLEKGRRRNPAVLLITSGCEKTEPQGSPKLSWQRDSSKRRSSLESRRAFVGYRERWWGRIPYKSVFSLVTISSPPNSNREMGVWLIISYHLQRPPDMALDSESHLRALKRPSETT